MKKTIILILIFAILGGATYYLLNKEEKKTTSTLGWDRQFRVKNTDEIQKIFLGFRDGEKVTLERENDHWIYNGKYRANPSVMKNLLSVIRNVEMLYMAPKSAEKTMIESLATIGIKVEIYNKKGENLKTYYVGGATPDEGGTYMILEGAETPYITHIPLFHGNLRMTYALHGDSWRDKTMFRTAIHEIQSVNVEYPKQKNKSFKIEREGDKFSVSPFFTTSPKIETQIKENAIEQYLAGFLKPGAEAFENNNSKRDSLTSKIPFCIINLTKIDGTKTMVEFHPLVSRYSSGKPKTTEVERYMAKVNDGEDYMLVQHRVFSKLFWGYDHFY